MNNSFKSRNIGGVKQGVNIGNFDRIEIDDGSMHNGNDGVHTNGAKRRGVIVNNGKESHEDDIFEWVNFSKRGVIVNKAMELYEDNVYEIVNFESVNNCKPSQLAISVQNGKKYYSLGKFKVLEDINMHVKEGTIYGLLGASGCGKTTLLSCIVGIRNLDFGKILIRGQIPGSRNCGVPGRLVGYMPQEIALNGEFTIREVCHCFGQLYGMKRKHINDRVDKLVELLDLKKCKTFIKNLSGGQKRRASFLVALLHEPEILILDEPTVGVDPVLRANIWNYLRELVATNGTTVLLTTHYIEEMRQADTVGIMRSGALIAEASPSQLLVEHNLSKLEDVVLHYCMKDDEVYGDKTGNKRKTNINEIELVDNVGYVKSNILPYEFNEVGRKKPKQTNVIHRVQSLVTKNLIIASRNIPFLLFIFVTPAIVTSIFCYAVGSPPSIVKIGIINDGLNGNCSTIPKQIGSKCSSAYLDCNFIQRFTIIPTPEIELHFYKNEKEALAGVDNKEVWGYIHFPRYFSQSIYDRTLGLNNRNDTIYNSRITVRLDTISVIPAKLTEKLIFQVYHIFATELLTRCGVDTRGKDIPIHIGTPIYGERNPKYTSYMAPGVTPVFIASLSSLTCGLALIIERKDGMIHRTKVAGVTIAEIMLSHFIPQTVVVFIQTGIAFLIQTFVFDIPVEGSPYLAFLATAWYSMSGMCLGFLFSTVFDEEKNAMIAGYFLLMPTFLVAGVLWPLECLPESISKFQFIFPGNLATEGIRSILLRGWGIDNYFVYMGFISTFLFIVFFGIIGAIIIKVKK